MIQFPQTFSALQATPDFVCFSNDTWEKSRRLRQIFTRFDQFSRVIFIQQPEISDKDRPYLDVTVKTRNLFVVVPYLTATSGKDDQQLKPLLDTFFEESGISSYVFWYSDASYYETTSGFNPALTIYDCSESIKGGTVEKNLIQASDLILTNDYSKFEDYKDRHDNVQYFPDSIDVEHFAQARRGMPKSENVRKKIGYLGEIDKKINMKMVEQIASARPEWDIILAGPISMANRDLCKKPNVIYLNDTEYAQLPDLISTWDAAILPYAHTESTCFFYPSCHLEMLAAGKQVVSTSIRHLRPFGEMGLIELADTVEEFILKLEKIITRGKNKAEWILQSHAYLASTSWDQTVKRMVNVIVTELNEREQKSNLTPTFSVCLN